MSQDNPTTEIDMKKATHKEQGIVIWILLMCALKAHNNKSFLEKISRELKKY